jgi:hypothetical protein
MLVRISRNPRCVVIRVHATSGGWGALVHGRCVVIGGCATILLLCWGMVSYSWLCHKFVFVVELCQLRPVYLLCFL